MNKLLLMSVVLLTGCGVARTASVQPAADMQPCGSAGRSCWQAKESVEIVEPAPSKAAKQASSEEPAPERSSDAAERYGH